MGKKMIEYSRAYIKEAANLALSRVVIMQCKSCGHPTIDGCVCPHCGCEDPNESGQEQSWIEI